MIRAICKLAPTLHTKNKNEFPIDDTHLYAVMGTSTSGEQKEAKKHVKMMFKCGVKPCAWCGW